MERTPALVLGIGNVLWADEGFGVRCVEALHERYDAPPGVRFVDGGTQGLYLVSLVREVERLLVLDAVDFGDPPGTLHVLVGAEVPRYAIAKKLSMHQVGFQDVLAAAELLGAAPREVVLVGVQPAVLEDFGGSLTPTVAARLDEALDAAVRQLTQWGFALSPRVTTAEPLLGPGLDRSAYEAQRPSADEACRFGDARVLAQRPRGER